MKTKENKKNFKMNVADLSSIELDYWVSRAEGYYKDLDLQRYIKNRKEGGFYRLVDWNYIGEIIKRDGICLNWSGSSDILNWYAKSDIDLPVIECHSFDPLEAVKKCIVKRKYGDNMKSKSSEIIIFDEAKLSSDKIKELYRPRKTKTEKLNKNENKRTKPNNSKNPMRVHGENNNRT